MPRSAADSYKTLIRPSTFRRGFASALILETGSRGPLVLDISLNGISLPLRGSTSVARSRSRSMLSSVLARIRTGNLRTVISDVARDAAR
jgi:hypothetical protein